MRLFILNISYWAFFNGIFGVNLRKISVFSSKRKLIYVD
jgi:hypothetical protein